VRVRFSPPASQEKQGTGVNAAAGPPAKLPATGRRRRHNAGEASFTNKTKVESYQKEDEVYNGADAADSRRFGKAKERYGNAGKVEVEKNP
jgi:hypothetical protein